MSRRALVQPCLLLPALLGLFLQHTWDYRPTHVCSASAPISEIVAFMKQLGAQPGMLGLGGGGVGLVGNGVGRVVSCKGCALHNMNSVCRRIPADDTRIAEIMAFMEQLRAKPGGFLSVAWISVCCCYIFAAGVCLVRLNTVWSRQVGCSTECSH
jgi:hypothetical protein